MIKPKLTKIQKNIINAIKRDKKANLPAPQKAYQYPDEYVAYYGGEIIAHGSDFEAVKQAAERKSPLATFVKNLPSGINII